jgi:hypothetical protein
MNYKKWTSSEKEELTQIKTNVDLIRFAKKHNRTYNSAYSGFIRYASKKLKTLPIKKTVVQNNNSKTVVFTGYKSVIVENNSILIEF